MERLGITMLINDKSQLKRNVEQIGFQLALITSKTLSWSDRLMQTVPYCRTGNREVSVFKFVHVLTIDEQASSKPSIMCYWTTILHLTCNQPRIGIHCSTLAICLLVLNQKITIIDLYIHCFTLMCLVVFCIQGWLKPVYLEVCNSCIW